MGKYRAGNANCVAGDALAAGDGTRGADLLLIFRCRGGEGTKGSSLHVLGCGILTPCRSGKQPAEVVALCPGSSLICQSPKPGSFTPIPSCLPIELLSVAVLCCAVAGSDFLARLGQAFRSSVGLCCSRD